MKSTYKIFLRSDYPKKDGSIPVYLRVISNRKKKDFAFGVSIFEPKKFWNEKEQRVQRCSWVNKDHINKTIKERYDRANDIIRELENHHIPLTFREFDMRFKNPIELKDSFYAFAEDQVKKLENPSPETVRSYNSYISKMKKYRPILTFGEITQDFIEQYREHMIANGNMMNTYHKALAWLRTICKRARAKGLMFSNPFEYFKVRRQPGSREALASEELESLEKLYYSGTLKLGVQNALKCFLFFCYNGLRFRDAKKLKHSDLKKETYNGKETFTFHIARHTFAVNCILLGIPIKVVSKLLGHTEIKTTQIYAKIVDDIEVHYMERFNDSETLLE